MSLRSPPEEFVMIVEWERPAPRQWYLFTQANVDCFPTSLEGIYIIWRVTTYPQAIRLGQGIIGIRLKEHLDCSKIIAYEEPENKLLVSWTNVPKDNRNGVERYLGDTLKPLVGCRFPDDPPISVNLPWS